MRAREFLSKLKSGTAPPSVILLGPGKAAFGKEEWEPRLADEVVQYITDTQIDPSMHDMALTVYYADEVSPGDVVMESQTMPFLAQNRVVIVRNAEKYNTMSGDKKSPLASLVEYLDNPAEFTTLVLVTSQLDKRKKFYKACAAKGELVECPQLEDRELVPWLEEAAAEFKKKLARPAAMEMIARTGSRLSELHNSIELVVNYVGSADIISLEDVIKVCADDAEDTVWDLTDAIAKSDSKKAMNSLYKLLDHDKTCEEIIVLINWLLGNAYAALPDTVPTLKSDFQRKKVAPLANKLGTQRLRRAFALCTDTHFMMRSTGVNDRLALELLVMKLTFPVKRTRR